jgi:hypothetical protein
VAVGETLRRLAGKVLFATGVMRAQVAKLSPTQVGVGVPGAVESVAIGLQAIVDQMGGTNVWMALKVDLSNAFNTVDRGQVLQAAARLAPAAYNFLAFAYSRTAPLFTGGQMLTSETGTHQGCPLGPLGFALAYTR